MHDVVVVGCGAAGLSAALSAVERGASVGVLERSTKELRGGNTRYTEAFFRMPNETEVSPDFVDRLADSSGGAIDPALLQHAVKPYEEWPPLLRAQPLSDPALIQSFADAVPSTIAWLKTYGLKFIESSPFITAAVKRIAPSGGGEAIVETLAPAAEAKGVKFYYETTARSLIQNPKGDVVGVAAWAKGHGNRQFESKAVILACGSYEGNLEAMIRYVGHNALFTRSVAPGGMYNKGEGVEMALAIGAAPAGQYDAFHAEPIDPRSGRPEANVQMFSYGILVNKLGKRFTDEAPQLSDVCYEEISRAILRQPGGIAYLIYDASINDVPGYEKAIRTDVAPIRARSIAQLASELGIDGPTLEHTITSYNASVQGGQFSPLELDGLCTKGIEPPKSNWARRIDENDLFALPMICSNVFSFGGVKATPNAEVLNRDGYVIPGLYAAGEVIGLYYGSYVGSTSVLRGLVFGRKAGQHAAGLKAAV